MIFFSDLCKLEMFFSHTEEKLSIKLSLSDKMCSDLCPEETPV